MKLELQSIFTAHTDDSNDIRQLVYCSALVTLCDFMTNPTFKLKSVFQVDKIDQNSIVQHQKLNKIIRPTGNENCYLKINKKQQLYSWTDHTAMSASSDDGGRGGAVSLVRHGRF